MMPNVEGRFRATGPLACNPSVLSFAVWTVVHIYTVLLRAPWYLLLIYFVALRNLALLHLPDMDKDEVLLDYESFIVISLLLHIALWGFEYCTPAETCTALRCQNARFANSEEEFAELFALGHLLLIGLVAFRVGSFTAITSRGQKKNHKLDMCST